jgi:hypothetical protein
VPRRVSGDRVRILFGYEDVGLRDLELRVEHPRVGRDRGSVQDLGAEGAPVEIDRPVQAPHDQVRGDSPLGGTGSSDGHVSSIFPEAPL